ncbi:uncharacterized protein [Typha angustifolia]|uniref:uncharacterized protein isoform X1 n=1 Tax=Typha angustifolia TaxID=59011 RepID=UPI003C2C8F4A
MERYLNYNKEYMKMGMLKHEETFRQQVQELHRLYRVQRLLMSDMLNGKRQQASTNTETNVGTWNAENDTVLNQPCYNYSDKRRPHGRLDLELPAEKCIGKDDRVDEENELKLTLATGSSIIQKRKQETSFSSESGTSFSSSSTESGGLKLHSFDINEGMTQDGLKHPPWLHQSLSMNMT